MCLVRMSSDSESDGEKRMRFTTTNDFENGQWQQGEFYYTKQRQGRTLNKEEQIYGVFDESDSDQETRRGGNRSRGGNGSNKRRRNQKGHGPTTTPALNSQPVTFVSGGGGGSGTTNQTDIPVTPVDETSQAFHRIIQSVQSAPPPTTNADFRDMVHTFTSNTVTPSHPTKKLPPPPSATTIGQWEKHTKGIGKKLLQKMGFTGRLGAKETGICESVTVKVRPAQLGLGYGDFVESSTLEENRRLEADLTGKEYVPVGGGGKKGEVWGGRG